MHDHAHHGPFRGPGDAGFASGPSAMGESYRVVEKSPSGLKVEMERGKPMLVTPPYVGSVSVRRHARGAGDGALWGGAAGALLGLTVGFSVRSFGGDGDGGTVGPPFVIFSTILFGLLGAALGIGPGALVGHHDEYVFTR